MPAGTSRSDPAADPGSGPDRGPYAPGYDFDTEPDDSEDEAVPLEPTEGLLNPAIRPIFVAVILIILMFFFAITTVISYQLF